jgi:glutathione S-transferase
MKLYHAHQSRSTRPRWLLEEIGEPYELVRLDLAKGEHKTPGYLAVNPLGSVPALDDNGVIIRDSAAILVYLGAKYGQGKWYPKSPKGQGKVQQWLALSSNEVFHGLAVPRAIRLGLRQGDAAAGDATGKRVLDQLETRLRSDDWLVAGKPTVADIAMYPYVAMAPQGGISLDQHLGVRKWMRRVEGLEGYLALPQPPRKT